MMKIRTMSGATIRTNRNNFIQWLVINGFVLALLIFLALVSTAKAMPWDHTAAEQCFNRWGQIATERLNSYLAAGDWAMPKQYRFNEFGEVVSTHIAVQVPHKGLYQYDNKYHWMWEYYYNGQYQWRDPLWQEAGVPQLRTFVRYCVRTYDKAHWTRVPLNTLAIAVDAFNIVQSYIEMPPFMSSCVKKMFVNPVYHNYRLSRCYSTNQECSGLHAAQHFCRQRGFIGADDYRLKRSVGPTRSIHDQQLCRSRECDGFAWIRCSGVAASARYNYNGISLL